MQPSSRRDILSLAEQEESDAVLHAHGVDSLIFRPDQPLPLPPVPLASAEHEVVQRSE